MVLVPEGEFSPALRMLHREAATIAGMNTASVKTHCGRLPGVTTKLHAQPVNVLSYQVGGNP